MNFNYLHEDQKEVIHKIVDRLTKHPGKQVRVLNLSEMGTGKTLTEVTRMQLYKQQGVTGTIVLGHIHVLLHTWVNELRQYAPELTWCYVDQSKSKKIPHLGIETLTFEEAFDTQYDVYLMYFDTLPEGFVKCTFYQDYTRRWNAQDKMVAKMLSKVSALVIDEATAYASVKSQRTRILTSFLPAPHLKPRGYKSAPQIDTILAHSFFEKLVYVSAMTGTPLRNDTRNIFSMMLILDRGRALGLSVKNHEQNYMYYAPEDAHYIYVKGQRRNVAEPRDRLDAFGEILTRIDTTSIVVRNLAEVLPHCEFIIRRFDLEPEMKALYDHAKKHAKWKYSDGSLETIINQSVLHTKLGQIASGAVYDADGQARLMHTQRYELICNTAIEKLKTGKCIIFYRWKHQADQIYNILLKRGIVVANMNGVKDMDGKIRLMDQFQKGDAEIILAHPQSAGHGLTLTAATTTIWATLPDSLEFYLQGCKRMHRRGQTKETEVIMFAAKGTVDEAFFSAVLELKLQNQKRFFKAVSEAEFLKLMNEKME